MDRKDLCRYRSETTYIEKQLEDIEIRKERLTKITPNYEESISGSKKINDSIAEKLAKILDDENKILQRTLDRMEERKKIRDAVNSMPNDKNYKTILYCMYISEKPMRIIDMYKEETLPKSYGCKYISSLHQEALEEFERRYND